jgi:hypothetical protein
MISVISCSDKTTTPEVVVITDVSYVITGNVANQQANISYTDEFGNTQIIWICTLPKTISYVVGVEYYFPSIEVNNLTLNSSINVKILLNGEEDLVGSCGGSGCQVYLEETE